MISIEITFDIKKKEKEIGEQCCGISMILILILIVDELFCTASNSWAFSKKTVDLTSKLFASIKWEWLFDTIRQQTNDKIFCAAVFGFRLEINTVKEGYVFTSLWHNAKMWFRNSGKISPLFCVLSYVDGLRVADTGVVAKQISVCVSENYKKLSECLLIVCHLF